MASRKPVLDDFLLSTELHCGDRIQLHILHVITLQPETEHLL